jgi:probable phosphoglycerate mutase
MLLVSIRHLPTEWNERGLLQGQSDSPVLEITPASEAAIRENLDRIRRLGPFDTVLTSELRRTQTTAAIYGFDSFTPEPLLNELDFGEWEGRTRDEFYAAFGDRWFADPLGLVLGESLADFQSRIARFLEKYRRHTSVLAFSHGSWMRALRSIRAHGDIRAMNIGWIENSELLEVRI